jgi:hypothetical protein
LVEPLDLLKPVLAQVHGNCLAGGLELMSMADIVFVADDARLGYPPIAGDVDARHRRVQQSWVWHYLFNEGRARRRGERNAQPGEGGIPDSLAWMNQAANEVGLL